MAPEEINPTVEQYRRKALAAFPLRLIETTGDQALATWQALKSAGQGAPVVLGPGNGLYPSDNLLGPFAQSGPYALPLSSVDDIVRAAACIRFPEHLVERRTIDAAEASARFKASLQADPEMPLPSIHRVENGITHVLSRAEVIAEFGREANEPPLGEWPTEPAPSAGLTMIRDFATGELVAKVLIGLAPTEDWTTIPAYLRWGGWNACPMPEYHVAAMRAWRDRYGAELVGMSSDAINIRVSDRPKSREEALALAREQYIYCPDLIEQGFQTLSALAAMLMADDWWFFWWD